MERSILSLGFEALASLWPGSASSLGCCGCDRLYGRIAKSHQNLPGTILIVFAQLAQRLAEGFHPKILFSRAAINPVKKGSQVDQFVTSIDKIEVKYLLPCHKFVATI